MPNLTPQLAASILGKSAGEIRRLCRAGRFHRARRLGRDWSIPKAAVEKMLANPVRRGRPRKSPPADSTD